MTASRGTLIDVLRTVEADMRKLAAYRASLIKALEGES